MVPGHVVLAGEQWLAIEYANAPVESGIDEFLGQDQVGFLEQLFRQRLEFLPVVGLVHTQGEGAVRDLEHDGKGAFVRQRRQCIFGHDGGFRPAECDASATIPRDIFC